MTDAILFRNRGNAFSRKGDVGRALADYEHAVALEPQHPAVYLNRGALYERTRQKEQAAADYQTVLRLSCDPRSHDEARERLVALWQGEFRTSRSDR